MKRSTSVLDVQKSNIHYKLTSPQRLIVASFVFCISLAVHWYEFSIPNSTVNEMMYFHTYVPMNVHSVQGGRRSNHSQVILSNSCSPLPGSWLLHDLSLNSKQNQNLGIASAVRSKYYYFPSRWQPPIIIPHLHLNWQWRKERMFSIKETNSKFIH